MKVADSKYGTIIYGKVAKIKPGSGNAASRLTIVSLAEINHEGKETGRIVKVLCWNSEKNEWTKLSDKARKLSIGQITTFRVVFDIGDTDKATAYEIKKQGVYHLITNDNKETSVLCGKIAKTVSSEHFFGIYIPVYQYSDGNWNTQWYLVSFFNEKADIQKNFLGKGDLVFINGNIRDVNLENMKFKQVMPLFIKSVSA